MPVTYSETKLQENFLSGIFHKDMRNMSTRQYTKQLQTERRRLMEKVNIASGQGDNYGKTVLWLEGNAIAELSIMIDLELSAM